MIPMPTTSGRAINVRRLYRQCRFTGTAPEEKCLA
jgi:hypothetical protein